MILLFRCGNPPTSGLLPMLYSSSWSSVYRLVINLWVRKALFLLVPDYLHSDFVVFLNHTLRKWKARMARYRKTWLAAWQEVIRSSLKVNHR